MKYLRNQEIITHFTLRDMRRRLVMRLLIMLILVAIYNIFVELRGFTHVVNVIVGGLPQ